MATNGVFPRVAIIGLLAKYGGLPQPLMDVDASLYEMRTCDEYRGIL